MSYRLVLAGDHQQYLTWLHEGGRSPADFTPVARSERLQSIRAMEVLSFDQVGTYWNNPVWGSQPYNALMLDGLSWDMHWAQPWETDFLRAQTLRDGTYRAAGQDEAAAALARHRRMGQMLDG